MGPICFNAQSARLGDATDSMESRELDATSFPMKLNTLTNKFMKRPTDVLNDIEWTSMSSAGLIGFIQ